MAAQGANAWLRISLFVNPIVLWLICLFFAVQYSLPRPTRETYKRDLQEQPQLAVACRGVYKEMVGYKHRNLKRAYWSLLAGFVPLVIAVVHYLTGLQANDFTNP